MKPYRTSYHSQGEYFKMFSILGQASKEHPALAVLSIIGILGGGYLLMKTSANFFKDNKTTITRDKIVQKPEHTAKVITGDSKSDESYVDINSIGRNPYTKTGNITAKQEISVSATDSETPLETLKAIEEMRKARRR